MIRFVMNLSSVIIHTSIGICIFATAPFLYVVIFIFVRCLLIKISILIILSGIKFIWLAFLRNSLFCTGRGTSTVPPLLQSSVVEGGTVEVPRPVGTLGRLLYESKALKIFHEIIPTFKFIFLCFHILSAPYFQKL